MTVDPNESEPDYRERHMPNGDPIKICKTCGLAVYGMGDMYDFAWYEVEDGSHSCFGEDGHEHEPEAS